MSDLKALIGDLVELYKSKHGHYPTAEEFKEELRDCGSGEPIIKRELTEGG